MAAAVLARDEQRPARDALSADAPRTTIAALASGRPPCAIAVVRVSGPDAFSAARALAGSLPRPRTAGLRALRRPSDRALLDRALLLCFRAPASATGEDVVELHLHGGVAVVSAVLAALVAEPGVRLAEPGEFTRRAFYHGKLDLTQAEGLADLLAAATEAQRAQATALVEGALSAALARWREDLIGLLAGIEAELDFPDDVEDAPDRFVTDVAPTLAAMRGPLGRACEGERIRDGVRIVLLGPPNVGKSSLLNALARRDVAIVTPLPGTTRDAIEVALDLGGVPVTLVDTAGLRDSPDPIEAEGIRRALDQRRRADLVLHVSDRVEVRTQGLAVRTKIDLSDDPAGVHGGVAYVSALTGDGLSALVSLLTERVAGLVGSGEPALVSNGRQREAIGLCALEIEAACGEPDPVGRAERLRFALRALGRVAGDIDAEEVLDQVFSRFCIGK